MNIFILGVVLGMALISALGLGFILAIGIIIYLANAGLNAFRDLDPNELRAVAKGITDYATEKESQNRSYRWDMSESVHVPDE